MLPENVTLYAIYQKTLTATFTDYNGTSPTTQEVETTIYNNASEGQVTLLEQNSYSGWTSLGWASSPSSLSASYASQTTVPIHQDTTFYGIYKNSFTLTYNANGGSPCPPSVTKTVSVNSSNITSISQSFTISSATINKGNDIFEGWSGSGGEIYQPGAHIPANANITIKAIWKQGDTRQ